MVNNVASTSPVFVNVAPKGQRAEYVQANNILGIQQDANNKDNYWAIVKVEQTDRNGNVIGTRLENCNISSEAVSKLDLLA